MSILLPVRFTDFPSLVIDSHNLRSLAEIRTAATSQMFTDKGGFVVKGDSFLSDGGFIESQWMIITRSFGQLTASRMEARCGYFTPPGEPDDLTNTYTLESSADKITWNPEATGNIEYADTVDPPTLVDVSFTESTDQYWRLDISGIVVGQDFKMEWRLFE